MAKKIDVILLEDVDTVGRAGDIVSVAEGYARNFLFADGKAALATSSAKHAHEERQAKAAAADEAKLKELQALAESLSGTELTLTARVKDGTEIYGKITAKNIAEQLNQQAKLTVKPRDILLPQPIIALGGQDVTIRLSPTVETTIHVTVVPVEGQATTPDDNE